MSKEKNEDKSQELHWIDYCHEELLGFTGLQPHIKEFNEGYFKVRKIVEDRLDAQKSEVRP